MSHGKDVAQIRDPFPALTTNVLVRTAPSRRTAAALCLASSQHSDVPVSDPKFLIMVYNESYQYSEKRPLGGGVNLGNI
jgi:hypothetical protein